MNLINTRTWRKTTAHIIQSELGRKHEILNTTDKVPLTSLQN